MLYYLFNYLDQQFDVPGAGMFKFISFRASVAAILSLLISLFIGKRIINFLKAKQIGESIRVLGPESHFSKKGTPTMGGIIILVSILIPTLLMAKVANIYVILMVVATIWMGAIGLADDYIKVFMKNKQGLRSKFKVMGQVGLGLLIAGILYWHPDTADISMKTNVPFYKKGFDYGSILELGNFAWLVYLPIIIFIVTAVTNAVNLTDGIDGLAAGTTAIVGGGLGILAYMSGNFKLAEYLNILYIPNSGETVIFLSSVVGACIGFLWYNTFPAQVFMGDTGSLALGGAIAAVAIIIKMELMLPILCGVYFVESLSVILQVSYFKYTKKKYGEGRRIFKMSPIHHHFELSGIPEPKIVTRFRIITVLLVIITIVLLKIR